MNPKITIIICSWRAPSSLNDTLTSIYGQETTEHFEVVLVNNGFNSETERRVQASFPKLLIISEPVPGQGHARRAGFRAAKGDWFVLLDDDNTINADFVANLTGILAAFPNLGGTTPLVRPVWERKPPAWLEEFGTLFLSYNETGALHQVPFEKYFPAHKYAEAERPPGGGMVIHRKVAMAYLNGVNDPRRIALARTGNSLVACEDQDLWSFIEGLHMDILVTNKLQVCHHIPATRLKMSYMLKLNFQMAYSYRMLERLKAGIDKSTTSSSIIAVTILSLRLIKIWLSCPNSHPFMKQILLIARAWGQMAGDLKAVSAQSVSS
jgi:glycosyltransferase involved in cell wall biosynthesis